MRQAACVVLVNTRCAVLWRRASKRGKYSKILTESQGQFACNEYCREGEVREG